MITNFAIEEIMRKNPVTLHPKDPISEAQDLFSKMEIHHIPIVVSSKVVGIISLGDLLFLKGLEGMHKDKFLISDQVGISKLDEVMTYNPICIDKKENIKTALSTMIEKRINCLPVVEDGKLLVGLITTLDILVFLKNKIQ